MLAGARKTLEALRPIIAMELAPYVHVEHGYSFDDLVLLLTGIGYGFRDIVSLKEFPADPHALRKLVPEGGSINVLAVPPQAAIE